MQLAEYMRDRQKGNARKSREERRLFFEECSLSDCETIHCYCHCARRRKWMG